MIVNQSINTGIAIADRISTLEEKYNLTDNDIKVEAFNYAGISGLSFINTKLNLRADIWVDDRHTETTITAYLGSRFDFSPTAGPSIHKIAIERIALDHKKKQSQTINLISAKVIDFLSK